MTLYPHMRCRFCHPPLLAALLLGCLSPLGCQMPHSGRTTDATALHTDQPSRRFAMSIDDFAELAPRAVADAHWAVTSRRDEITGYAIDALTAGDKPVEIRARQTDEQHITVSVKVGYFDDDAAETEFLDLLHARLEHTRQRARR